LAGPAAHGMFMRKPFLILLSACLAWPTSALATAVAPIGSVDLGELVRRETESAAARELWRTFKTGALSRARRAYQRRRYRRTTQLLQTWLAKHPEGRTSHPVRFLLASAQLRLGQHTVCAKGFGALAKDYAALRDAAALGQARCRLGAGRFAAAIEALEGIPGDSAESAEARGLLIWTRYNKGDRKALLGMLAERDAMGEEMLAVERYVHALLLRDSDLGEQSAEKLRGLIREQPGSAFTGPALVDLVGLRSNGRFIYSRAERRAVAAMRKRLVHYHGFGPDRTLGKLGVSLSKIRRSRLRGEVALARAVAAAEKRDLESAVSRFRVAARTAQDSGSRAYALYGLGDMQNRRGRFRSARDAFKRVMSVAPNMLIAESALFAVADMDARLGRVAQAQEALNEIMLRNPLTPNRPRILWSLGWINFREGNFQEAHRLFESLLEERVRGRVGEGRPRILYWSGRSAVRLGRMDDARLRFGELMRDYPLDYYTSTLADFVAIRGLSVERLGPAGDAGMAAIASEAGLVKAEGLLASGMKSAARKAILDYVKGLMPESAGRHRYRSFAGGIRLAPLDEPTSAQLARTADLLQRVGRPGWAKRVRSLQAGGELAPLVEAQRSKWLKESVPRPFWYAVRRWSTRYRLDPMLVYALIRQESQFNPRAHSSADAYGLMQIIPTTAAQVSKWIGLRPPSRDSLTQPNLNVRLGTRYLANLLRRYKGRIALAVAAYNAGPSRVDRWMRRHGDRPLDEWVEEIPFDETRDYVKRVLTGYLSYRARYRPEPQPKVSAAKR
jgi:soluble lytic murein transglycosylase